ncbi:hypothetical protein ABIA38_002531 [Embleya sp. AB8]
MAGVWVAVGLAVVAVGGRAWLGVVPERSARPEVTAARRWLDVVRAERAGRGCGRRVGGGGVGRGWGGWSGVVGVVPERSARPEVTAARRWLDVVRAERAGRG